jgi:replicative DNA helicase
VILSKIHGFKTNFLVNVASRQALKGFNPLIISLEMSEDSLCQRLDSIYSKEEINSMYVKEQS